MTKNSTSNILGRNGWIFWAMNSGRRYKKAKYLCAKFQDDWLTFTPVIVWERKCASFQKYFFPGNK